MNIRQPVRAGMFYESSPTSCRLHAEKLIDAAELPDDLPDKVFGGLVPHAGWMYSGRLAAMTFKAVARSQPQTIVLFGADHVGTVEIGEVYESGVWRTPLGEVRVDKELAAALLLSSDSLRANPKAHAQEHSLEVQAPILQAISPDVMIVPIAVPPIDLAVEIGQAVGNCLANWPGNVCIVGSTDLSHHGGHFPAPGGKGAQGQAWTTQNDQRIIDLIEKMDAAGVIIEAASRRNACGAGAIAATIAACSRLGAKAGRCLEYTNSYRVIREIYPQETDDTTVGYASVIFA